MIRSTQQTLYRLDNLNNEQQRISYQMSTGKKIQYGSDDANTYSREIYIDDKIKMYEGIKLQIEKTTAQNNGSDSTLADAKDLVSYIKAEVIKALNDTTDDTAKLAIATNLEGVKVNLFALANEQIEGEYLYAGSDSSVKPFVMDESNGIVSYAGNDDLRKVVVENGTYRDRGVNGLEAFYFTSDSATTGGSVNYAINDVLYDENGDQWELRDDLVGTVGNTITFSGGYDLIDNNGNYWTLNTGVPEMVDAQGNTLPVTGSGPYSVTLAPGDGIEWLKVNELRKVDASGNQDPATGVAIQQNASDELYVDVTTSPSSLEVKSSVFNVLDNIINALKSVDSFGNSVTAAEAKTALQTGLDEITEAYDFMNAGHGKLGGRNQVFEISLERVSAKVSQYNILAQEVGAADYSKVAVEAKALELTYTALYSTINRMNELSLVNFVR